VTISRSSPARAAQHAPESTARQNSASGPARAEDRQRRKKEAN